MPTDLRVITLNDVMLIVATSCILCNLLKLGNFEVFVIFYEIFNISCKETQ